MLKMTRIALLGALLGAGSLAFAAGSDSASITVNATVPGVCKLTSTNATLNLAANPATGGDVFDTAPVTFKCTKNHPYTFSVSQGASSSTSGSFDGSLANGATTVPFTATWTQPSGTGAGFNNEVSAGVKVTIAETAYADLPAATYTGALTVKIDY